MLNKTQNHYIAGLDGLRSFAILFIVAYHFSFRWASGGFLGVDIFFVLSGYLITSNILLLQGNGLDFNLRKFWSGRIRRLLPAAYTMIMATVIWVIFFNWGILTTLWGDAVSSVFYTTNWWFIFHKLSYFDSFGTPSPLKHLWFMAVQEQFFFVWPVVLIIGLKYVKKREKLLGIVFMLALCSSLLMSIMYKPGADPSRIYYGTDTRSFELLIGSLLAMVLPIDKFSFRKTSNIQRNRLTITSIATFAVFIFSAIFMDEYQAFLYRGGIFLLDLNIAVLIACICHPSNPLGNIFSWKPLRWIGIRSYGIYLWHYPIIVLSTPIYEIGNPAYWRIGLQLVIACIIAELSYRFIETPIRKFGFRGFYREYLSFRFSEWEQLALVKKVSTIIAASVIMVLVIGITKGVMDVKAVEKGETYPTEIVVSSTGQIASYKDSKSNSSENDEVNSEEQDEVDSNDNNMTSSEGKNGTGLTKKSTANSYKKNETNSLSANKRYKEILAIGDSIMLDIAPSLQRRFSNIAINGKVARQVVDASKLAPVYAGFNDVNKAVIIELGTNGYFTNQQIDRLLDSFSKSDIYLVNTRVPRSWEKAVNKVLKRKAEERENVTLVDWYSIAIKHPEYFERDGVHLKPSGSESLASLISKALDLK